RIRDVRLSKTVFRRPLDFSIARYLEQSFGVFTRPAKTKHAIRIVFDEFAAPRIQERQWHPSQKLKQLQDGGIELSLTLGNLEEIERCILSWGSHFGSWSDGMICINALTKRSASLICGRTGGGNFRYFS